MWIHFHAFHTDIYVYVAPGYPISLDYSQLDCLLVTLVIGPFLFSCFLLPCCLFGYFGVVLACFSWLFHFSFFFF